MAQQKDQLHELIQSLSASEKGYCKKLAAGESGYLRLFNAISSQKDEYNEELLKKKCKGEKFLKHLAVSKKYLYDFILDGLAQYHATDSAKHQLRKHIRHIEMLAKKGLYRQCRKVLNKAMKLAEEYDMYALVQELIYWEKYLTVYEPLENLEEHDEKLLKKELDAVEKIKTNILYEMLFKKMFLFSLKNSQVRNKADEEYVREIMAHPLLKDSSAATTVKSKIFYNRTHILFYKMTGNFEKSLEYCRNLVHSFEENIIIIKKSPKNYLEEYQRYLIYCVNAGKEEEFTEQLTRFRQMPGTFGFKTGDPEKNILFESYVLEMNFYLLKSDFKRALKILEHIKHHLGNNEAKVRTIAKTNIYYQAASAYFATGNYPKSLEWLSRLLNNKDFQLIGEKHVKAKILNLILHYELGNYDMIEGIFKSTYRFLLKKQKPYEYEKLMLQFLKKLPEISSQSELIKLFAGLKKTLKTLEKDPFEKSAIETFGFTAYLETKIKLN